jgi:hypothetical protein
MITKQTSRAFGKDIYLLGRDADGTTYWLEAPTWDCGWYWGFGYVETYTNNLHPEFALDISSHQHATHEFFESGTITDWTVSDKELWEIRELFAQFYTLRKTAEYFDQGKANVGNTSVPLWKNPELVDEINNVRIPLISTQILEILSA